MQRLGLILAFVALAAQVACSKSSSQPGGEDAAVDAPADVAADVAPQACACGEAFVSCPASRPCVLAVTTESSCAGQVCCGPATSCQDGGAGDAAGDGRSPLEDASEDGGD